MKKVKKWIKKLFKRIYKFWHKHKANIIELGNLSFSITKTLDFIIRNWDIFLNFIYIIIDLFK